MWWHVDVRECLHGDGDCVKEVHVDGFQRRWKNKAPAAADSSRPKAIQGNTKVKSAIHKIPMARVVLNANEIAAATSSAKARDNMRVFAQ